MLHIYMVPGIDTLLGKKKVIYLDLLKMDGKVPKLFPKWWLAL